MSNKVLESKTWGSIVIFLIIGILLTIIAYFCFPDDKIKEFPGNVLLNIAFVFLTVVLLFVFWEIFGGDPNSKMLSQLNQTSNELITSVKLVEDSHSSGLQRVLPASSGFRSSGQWIEELKTAEENVDLMGYTLYVWTKGKDFKEEIIKLINKGVKIRILLMDSANPYLQTIVNNTLPEIIVDPSHIEINGMLNVLNDIKTQIEIRNILNAGNFEFRTAKRGIILCQLCRIDSKLTAINYLYSAVASLSPLLYIQGKSASLFQVYENEFNHLWELNDPKNFVVQSPPMPIQSPP